MHGFSPKTKMERWSKESSYRIYRDLKRGVREDATRRIQGAWKKREKKEGGEVKQSPQQMPQQTTHASPQQTQAQSPQQTVLPTSARKMGWGDEKENERNDATPTKARRATTPRSSGKGAEVVEEVRKRATRRTLLEQAAAPAVTCRSFFLRSLERPCFAVRSHMWVVSLLTRACGRFRRRRWGRTTRTRWRG